MLLDGKIDELIDMIIEGKTFRDMAAHFGVNIATVHNFLALKENAERAGTALNLSADSYADKAEETLITAPSDSVEITRARELAQHYRWKASKRSPRRYGDKLDLTSDGDKLQSVAPQVIVYNSAPPLASTEDAVE